MQNLQMWPCNNQKDIYFYFFFFSFFFFFFSLFLMYLIFTIFLIEAIQFLPTLFFLFWLNQFLPIQIIVLFFILSMKLKTQLYRNSLLAFSIYLSKYCSKKKSIYLNKSMIVNGTSPWCFLFIRINNVTISLYYSMTHTCIIFCLVM
jgi:hypothetical protein